MYLLLIRHGETDWNSQGRMQGRIDLPLNVRGIEQVERLAARLAEEERIDVLYTSPLLRARATAEVIAQSVGLNPIPDLRLVERSVGKLEGLTLQDFELSYPDLYQLWRNSDNSFNLPDEETREECLERVQSFLAMLRSRYMGARVALVTHGGTLSLMLGASIGLDLTKRFPFRFDNASLSKVDMRSMRPRIDLLNDTCHLQALHRATLEPSMENVQKEVSVLSNGAIK
jgi:broad specificity phosphatase PhoE